MFILYGALRWTSTKESMIEVVRDEMELTAYNIFSVFTIFIGTFLLFTNYRVDWMMSINNQVSL